MKLLLIALLFMVGCKTTPRTVYYYQDKKEPWQQAVDKGVGSWGFVSKRLETPLPNAVTITMVKWGIEGSQGEYCKENKTVYINTEARQYNNMSAIKGVHYWNEVPMDYDNITVLVAHEMGHYFGLADYDMGYGGTPDEILKRSVMNVRLLNKWDKLPTQEDIDKARKLFR